MSVKIYRILSILIAFALAFGTFTNSKAGATNLPAAQFTFQNKILSISTGLMELRIENGAINYIRDTASGELLLDSSATANRPASTDGFIGFTSKDSTGNYHFRSPVPASSVTFSSTQENVGQLTYTVYHNGTLASDSKLVYDISVDASGEVLIQLTGVEGSSGYTPFSVDLPFVNAATQSVILGSGAEYLRADNSANDHATFIGLGLFSPTMAVLKGNNAVISAWSESTRYQADNINLTHTPAYDHVVLHADADVSAANPQQIVSPVWRIGTYSSWYEAARRWKVSFENRTGAKPLWQNTSNWVRNIHAVYDATNNSYASHPEKFAELASLTAPQKTLYFEWNGDRIILFGDHTLAKGNGRPSDSEVQLIKQYGWPMILYHPYTLMYNENGASNRLQQFQSNDWLPSGYQFSPDYVGTASDWQSYWADVKATYDTNLYVINPASDKFQAYLTQNFTDYCNQHGANGAYMDTLGSFDVADRFTPAKQVINGDSFVLGEMKAVAQTRAASPQLGMMSEFASPWLIPYVFYTWEGTETFVRQNQYAHTRLNHPLRVALTGSYTWSQEDNTQGIDDTLAALLGTLPQISMTGDFEVTAQRAQWSQARAKLFTEQELFNDIPPVWQDGALAYYRSKSGNWFAYKKIGSLGISIEPPTGGGVSTENPKNRRIGRAPRRFPENQKIGAEYGYVEILPDGSEVVRLSSGDVISNENPTSTFADTPYDYWAWQYVERLYNSGITTGCSLSPLNYCPDNSVTRAEMSVFLLKAIYGSSFAPPDAVPTFLDTSEHWAVNWIQALKDSGLTNGYADGTYRPDNSVTRGEMAVFLLKAMNGSAYAPPAAAPTFSDTSGHWAANWIEALKAAGITSGYPDGTYRPDNSVTRAEMAVFLAKAFELP